MSNYKNQHLEEFLINMLDAENYKPAELEAGIQHSAKNAVRQLNGTQFKLTCPIQQFRRYDLAVLFFFRFVRLTACILILLFLIHIPCIINNYNGEGLNEYATIDMSVVSRLMRFSLANQEQADKRELNVQDTQYSQVYSRKMLQAITDFVSTLILLCFTIYWEWWCGHQLHLSNSSRLSPSHYTVFVRELPEGLDELKLAEHFNQLATVTQVSLVKDISKIRQAVDEFMRMLDDYRESCRKWGKDSQQAERQYSNMETQYERMKLLYRHYVRQPYNMAFVSFDSLYNRDYVVGLYSFGVSEDRLLRISDRMPEVTACRSEPTNLVWENISVENSTRIRLAILMVLLFVLVMIVGITLLFLIKLNTGLDFDIDHKNEYSYPEVLSKNKAGMTQNFCYRLGYRSLTPEYYHLCSNFVRMYSQHLFSSIAYSIIIVLIYYFLNLIVANLSSMGRYATRSQNDRTLTLNLFVVMFLNTALIPLLLQWRIGTFSFRNMIIEIFNLNPEKFHIRTYDSFSRRWYLDVGSQIVLTYIISFIVCPLIWPFNEQIMKMVRWYRAKRQHVQKAMNDFMVDPEFDWNCYYAQYLGCLFFCLSYSFAMPFMYLFGGLALLATGLQAKIVFVRYSRQPRQMNQVLNETAARAIPFALLIHSIFAILFESVTSIQPKLNGAVVFGLMQGFQILLLIFYIVFRKDVASVALRVVNWLLIVLRRERRETITIELEDRSFEEIWKNRKELTSYRFEDNPRYTDLLYVMLVLCHLIRKQEGEELEIPLSQHQYRRQEEGAEKESISTGKLMQVS